MPYHYATEGRSFTPGQVSPITYPQSNTPSQSLAPLVKTAKTTCSHLMPSKQHLYNGLARSADYSIFAQKGLANLRASSCWHRNGLTHTDGMLDFSKAFDVISHHKLLFKLQHYGINGKLSAWIKDFLICRHQRVVVDSTASTSTLVHLGVPQGTCLGPILFLCSFTTRILMTLPPISNHRCVSLPTTP